MKLLNYFLAVNLLFISNLSLAATNDSLCSTNGYTIATINGVFTDDNGAKQNKEALEFGLGKEYKGEKLKVDYLFNPSHLGGLGDIAVSVYQKIFDSGKVEDYDLVEMLKTASEQVHTQKLLLVAHSQGNFYANSFYDVITDKVGGVPKESIGVYGVATPAGRVAGDGKWLTSDTDTVIAGVVARAPFKNIMAPNTHIELQNGNDSLGHSFSDVYLKYRGDRIIADIKNSLNKLSENNIQGEQELCIVPPELTLAHKAVGVVLAVADPIATAGSNAVVNTAMFAYKTNKFIANLGERAVVQSGTMLVQVYGTMGNFFSNLFARGSNNSGLALVSEIDLEKNEPANEFTVISNKNEISNEVSNVNTNNTNVVGSNIRTSAVIAEQDEDEAERLAKEKQQTTLDKQQSTTNNNIQQVTNNSISVLAGAGQGEKTFPACSYNTTQLPTHQKLLINEVAWMGGPVSANDEWFELKNISGGELDISGWQVLDKGEQIKITFSNGKKLSAGGFLFLERTDDDSVPGVVADTIYAGALSNTDEGLRLFDDKCNLVDEAVAEPNWSAGDSAARKTMERGSDLNWHTYSGSGETFGSQTIFGTPKKENGSTSSPQVVPELSLPLKILISEVKISGNTSSDEFVELYNLNNEAVDLTGWSVKRKTSGGTEYSLVSASRLDGKSIPVKGYFLLAHETDYSDSATPDATWAASYSIASNNTVIVYDSNGAVVDKLGFGSASDYEANPYSNNPAAGQSLSRVSETDTDNNANDFISANLSPKNSSVSGGFLAPQSANAANTVLISEIFMDMDGADTGEFIELYNPTGQSISLADWSLQYLSGGATSTDKIVKKNFPEGTVIYPKQFYLVGAGGYAGTAEADMTWSQSLNNTGATVFLVNSTSTIEYADDDSVVDKNAYGTGSGVLYPEGTIAVLPGEGKSLERKSLQNESCFSAQDSNEFLGNGCDTDTNSSDFEVRNNPNPQNSQSFPETREKPTAPENFSAQLDTAALILDLSWDESEDYNGSTEDMNYLLKYSTSSFDNLKDLDTVSDVSYQFQIQEIGVNYYFSVISKDRDGLTASTSATTTLAAPSPLANLYFYKDTRATTSNKYLLDFYYDNYPFAADVYQDGGNLTWKALVFYLNKEASTEPELNTGNNWQSEDSAEVLGVAYKNCAGGSPQRFSLILPDTSDRCGTGGGIENNALGWEFLEDNHLLVELSNTADVVVYDVDDYFTVGMYSFFQSGGGVQSLKLSALDRNKYYFQNDAPAHQVPATPANFEFSFIEASSLLRIIWDDSLDSDTLDNLVEYEINYTNSFNVLDDNNWGSLENVSLETDENLEVNNRPFTKISVEPETTYLIGVRAKDDFGNYSDIATTTYTVPAITPPYGFSDFQWGHLNSSSVVELSFGAAPYPFMSSGTPSAILFFLNQSPPGGYSFSNSAERWEIGGANAVLKLQYSTCNSSTDSLLGGLLMHNASSCPVSGSGLKKYNVRNDLVSGQTSFTSAVSGVLENGSIASHTFSSGDYVTFGFYELSGSIFQESATYNKKFYFQE